MQPTDHRDQICLLQHFLSLDSSMSLLYLCHKILLELFWMIHNRVCMCWGRGKKRRWEKTRRTEQVFLGCELLESRAVMGITEGDAERNLLGRTGPLWLARHVYRDQGDESTDWFHHWSQQQAKGECNHSHETHQSQITCLLRRKKNRIKDRQTE